MSDNRDLGRRFLGAMMGLNAPPPFDEPPERTPRHHSVFQYARNDTNPSIIAYSVVNEFGYTVTDDPIETEEQADAIALYRDIQDGYIPSPDELAATYWDYVAQWERAREGWRQAKESS